MFTKFKSRAFPFYFFVLTEPKSAHSRIIPSNILWSDVLWSDVLWSDVDGTGDGLLTAALATWCRRGACSLTSTLIRRIMPSNSCIPFSVVVIYMPKRILIPPSRHNPGCPRPEQNREYHASHREPAKCQQHPVFPQPEYRLRILPVPTVPRRDVEDAPLVVAVLGWHEDAHSGLCAGAPPSCIVSR